MPAKAAKAAAERMRGATPISPMIRAATIVPTPLEREDGGLAFLHALGQLSGDRGNLRVAAQDLRRALVDDEQPRPHEAIVLRQR